MDWRELVLRKEGDGKGNYDRWGAEAAVPAFSRIFSMLSQDEVRHAEALRAMLGGVMVEMVHSATADGARTLLRRLSVQDAALSNFDGDPSCFGRAMDYEGSNARICYQLAREVLHGWERELLLRIAAEDEMHFTLLEHMRELLLPALCADAGRGEVCDAS